MDGVDGMGWDRWRGYPRDGDLCRAERLALAVILVLELDAQNLRRRVGDWKVKFLVPGGIQVVFLGRRAHSQGAHRQVHVPLRIK